MAQRYQMPDGSIFEQLPDGTYQEVIEPQAGSVFGPDPLQVAQDQTALATARQRLAEAQQSAPLDNALKAAQLNNLQNPRSAPPSGYRYKADGSLEPIPGAPQSKAQANSGALDALVNQINETRRLFRSGPGATAGLGGLLDFVPGLPGNSEFDVAANQLEDQAAMAFKVPGAGAQSDADAARIAAANKPNRWNRDSANETLFRGLQARVDAMRKAQGLPPAKWVIDANGNPVQQQDDAQAIGLASGGGGGGSNPPTPPSYNGPAGYDVAGVTPGSPGGGGGFANAAGVAMAGKLAKAYNQGATLPQLNSLLTENGFQPFTDPKAIEQIQRRGPLNFAPPVLDDTRGTVGRVIGNAADSATGAYFINAGDALTAGNLDTLAGGPTNLAMDYSRQQYPGASLLGSVTGGALAAGGAELGLARAGLTAGRAALGGDALYGAAYGAGSTDEGNRLLGAAAGGTGGLLGGIAGRAAARGIGGALTGVRNADVQGLRQAGVPLTAGQVAGGTLKGIEDRLSGIPVVGDIVNARRLEGFQGFNRAAFDEALAPIGANTGGVTGEAGIDAARRAIGSAYDQALTGVRVQADAPFVQDMTGAIQAGRALPDPMSTRADYTLNTRVGNSFGPNGELDGRGFQQSLRGLQRDAAAVRNEPYGYDFGQVADQARSALEGMLARQAPDALPQYNSANQAFRQTEIIRDAVNRARNGTRVGEAGTFAPSQLSDAAAANARRFGNSQGTTNQPFFNLTRAGQAVLPNSVPDSGTAGRAVVASGLGLLGAGGAGGYAAGDTGTGAGLGLGAAALLAAGGSRGGQRALTALLADRPDALIQLGNEVQRRARYGGIFGAPMLAGGMTALVPQ